MAMKFFNKKVYIVPGNAHRFRTEHDAIYYCNQHGIDTSTIEKYDSIKEYDRWIELQKMQADGRISDLRRQDEQNAVYTADFVFVENGVTVVEDCKSEYTRKEKDYVLRRKLMLHVHGIRIVET